MINQPSITDTEEVHYDVYDYSTFWHGREYENISDTIAVNALLYRIKAHDYLIDVGGGLGRLVPCYIGTYKRASLIDPSSVQLKKTEEYIGEQYANLSFIQGTAEHLPLSNNAVDTILCVRVSHHIPNMVPVAEEYHRVLAPGGYVILEVANKLHMKARLKALYSGRSKKLHSHDPIAIRVYGADDSIPFVNHHPKAIAALLEEKGFEIITTRSVSNFRSGFLKKYLPVPVLIFFERLLQAPLAPFLFGPSIYFLARKK